MESIKVRRSVGQDGILHLDIPIGMQGDLEVMVIYQPVPSAPDVKPLEQFYGICSDDPIVVDDQGISERLDDDLAGAFD